MQTTSENTKSFITRFFIYQNERFPFLSNGLLIACFSFSAISYSRICRGVEGFISWPHYGVVIFTTILLFYLLRVFDEFKDQEDDANFRKHLPVPRGLISLRELGITGILVVILQIIFNGIFLPQLLFLYFVALAYMLLMAKEFFISSWLKRHQFWYVVSHMFIIPIIDIYASGSDWLLSGVSAPKGLGLFFLVSFMNGIVIEVGRKIKNAEREEFNTYTTMMGIRRAPVLWLIILFATLLCSIAAAWYAGYGISGVLILCAIFCFCSIPGFRFIINPDEKNSKLIEKLSGIWTLCMYLTLGGVPMLMELIKRLF